MPIPDDIDTPAPSVVFSTLASQRRRLVLRELLDGEKSVTSLAQKIASEKANSEPRRIYAQLHHSHLPKLEDSGFVSVEDGIITLVCHPEAIEPYLILAERYGSQKE
ncbi:hypothetical protein SAMN05421858_2502 [Haladaptatus litoreus]|uniref:DUF7344 domain-containing protein n=1 Tax=Haladaptatus litoreus TaxID=553468 RepID=A0A1N7BEC0_9EURY|nr:transcriptional regulator [Haladaptatus litoreus]SIR49576.1 hypothetical protein SAMN05421858_2502 [Haladaptatus litoreus]